MFHSAAAADSAVAWRWRVAAAAKAAGLLGFSERLLAVYMWAYRIIPSSQAAWFGIALAALASVVCVASSAPRRYSRHVPPKAGSTELSGRVRLPFMKLGIDQSRKSLCRSSPMRRCGLSAAARLRHELAAAGGLDRYAQMTACCGLGHIHCPLSICIATNCTAGSTAAERLARSVLPQSHYP